MPKRKAEAEAQAPPDTESAGSSCNQQLTAYIRSGKSGLYVTSYEETRVENEFAKIVAHLDSIKKPDDRAFGLYTWSLTQGIVNVTDDPPTSIPDTEDPLAPNGMLDTFNKLPERSILLARDFHALLGDSNPLLIRKVKDCLAAGKMANRVFVILGCELRLPPELSKEVSVVEFRLPDKAQLQTVLTGIANSAGILLNGNGNEDLILDAGLGGTTTEFEDWLSIAVVESSGKEIDHNIIAREKALALKKSGILEVVKTDITFDDLGGLDELKAWTHRRVRAFTKEATAYHLPMPKGICLFGVQGCGKSYATKAIANELQVPLLKLDAGKLFGSLVGQSEATTRAVINQVEAFGKCVLQIEELDKSFAGMKSSSDGDSGTTRRVVGTFLSWMQEKTSPVFIVATANDLTKLPPELLRKGRWDELVFVDLPTETERVEIWRVQIRRHHRSPDDFDLSALSKITDGWSGAEIEALFNEALYAAFDETREPDTELIVALSKDTAPLSKMMASEIEALRQWANGRAKRASRAETIQVKAGSRKLA